MRGGTAKSKRSQDVEFLLESRLEKQQTKPFLPQKGEFVRRLAVVCHREYNLPCSAGAWAVRMGLVWCWMKGFLMWFNKRDG